MKCFVLLFAAILALAATRACADVSVALAGGGSVGEATYAPTGRVFASTEKTRTDAGVAVDCAMGWRWDDVARREIAQSFRTNGEDVVFDKMTFKTGGAFVSRALQDNPKAAFRLSVYRLPSAKALPSSPEAEMVSEQIGSFSGFAVDRPLRSGNIDDTAHCYISFSFKPVALQRDSYYAVVLSFVQAGQGYSIPMAQNGDNHETYTEGSGAILEDGGGWQGAPDFYFYAESVNGKSLPGH